MPETPPPFVPFASDNYAGTHPEVLAAVMAANEGFAVAYGDDPWTARLGTRVEEVFGAGARAFPVVNGTGANVVSLMALSERWGGVVTSDVAHVNTDENGAPERVGGLKMLPCPSDDGRIAPFHVERWARQRHDVHRAHPGVLSLTQSTELGTVYSLDALRDLVDTAHGLGMAVHLDGSRLANAAVALGCSLRALTTDVGIDVVSLGAAKIGGMLGEAVVVLGPDAAPSFPGSGYDGAASRRGAAAAVPYVRKATMQLASKARFVSAQLLALLGDPGEPVHDGAPSWAGSGAGGFGSGSGDAGFGAAVGSSPPAADSRETLDVALGGHAGLAVGPPLWHRTAVHANAMAARLHAGLADAGLIAAGPVGSDDAPGHLDTTASGGAEVLQADGRRTDDTEDLQTGSRRVDSTGVPQAGSRRVDSTGVPQAGSRRTDGAADAGVQPAGAAPSYPVRITRPVEANAVFATLPRGAADRLRVRSRFYDWGPGETPDRVEARWMCSWDTPPEAVDAFVAALAADLHGTH
ncbi:threonine aldolase family protein [Isoptericola jiangsuensis]|uniref:threonine aldolase family protein n=1 Tax=Isoptericola jiangsuensis TaxID=548579 RepID=UPI003AAD83B6